MRSVERGAGFAAGQFLGLRNNDDQDHLNRFLDGTPQPKTRPGPQTAVGRTLLKEQSGKLVEAWGIKLAA
jgi:hypothetical protein